MESPADLSAAPQPLPACAFAAPLAPEPDMPVLLSLGLSLAALLLLGATGLAAA